MCSESSQPAQNIMSEMVRVTRKGALFITHGGPKIRKKLFKNLPVKVDFVKQPLSDQADLINCLRSCNKDKSIKEVMGDTDALLNAMSECFLTR